MKAPAIILTTRLEEHVDIVFLYSSDGPNDT